jgi:hypothetical protein
MPVTDAPMVSTIIAIDPSVQTLFLDFSKEYEEVDFSDQRKYRLTLSDAEIQGLAYTSPKLRSVIIRNCRNISNGSIIALAVKSGPNYLLNVDLQHISGDLQSSSVSLLLRNSVHLESLNISQNRGLNDDTFTALRSTMDDSNQLFILKRLKYLNMSSCSFTSLGIVAAAEMLPKLRYFDISNHKHITDSAIEVLVQCCKRLWTLNISDCIALTDTAIVSIATHSTFLHALMMSSKVL